MGKPGNDWYLKEWLHALNKRQADIVKDLDWNKAKVSLMTRGKQPYTREEVNELAAYLHLRPHELLMHPEDANAIRRLKAEMVRLAHSTPLDEEAPLGENTAQKKVSLN